MCYSDLIYETAVEMKKLCFTILDNTTSKMHGKLFINEFRIFLLLLLLIIVILYSD